MATNSDDPKNIYKQVSDSQSHIEDLARQFLNNVCQSNQLINDHVELVTSILDSINEGLIVVDANNELLLTNEAAVRLAGIDNDMEWLSQLKEHYEFYTSTSGFRITPGEGSVAATLKDRSPHVTEVFVRSPRISESGAWFRLSSAPIFRQDGTLQGAVTVFQDISDAKSALRRVKELYNSAPCGYHSLDAAGVITEINDTELAWLGISADDLINVANFKDFLAPSSQETFDEQFASLQNRGSISNIELELIGGTGEKRNVLWSSMAVKAASGNFQASRCTLFDFTERKHLQQEVDSLAALIAHDIKNHLVATAGVIELIAEDVESNLSSESRAVMKTLQTSNQDQLQSLNNLINLWAAGERLPPEDVDVMRFIHEAVKLVGELSRLRNVRIEVAAVKAIPKIWAPATAFRHVLCNLLHNAIKFSKTGESVQVDAYPEKDGVTVVVSDKGPGISKREMESLFRVRTGKQPTGFSSGLGLYLCRQIVESAGGSIDCETEPGKGTRFFLHMRSKTISEKDSTSYSI